MSLEEVEGFLIKKALARYGGNVSHAAKALGSAAARCTGGSSASDCDGRRPISSRASHARPSTPLRNAGARGESLRRSFDNWLTHDRRVV